MSEKTITIVFDEVFACQKVLAKNGRQLGLGQGRLAFVNLDSLMSMLAVLAPVDEVDRVMDGLAVGGK